MPFWNPFLKSKSSNEAMEIKLLKQKVEKLTSELQQSQEKITEITRLLNYTITSQKQLSMDMNIIYESVTQVAETLQVNHVESDEKYFKWRWTVNDDDDDLPN